MRINIVLEEDFNNILDSNIDWEQLRNKSILVTGATGLIGSLLVRCLIYCSNKRNLDINLIAQVRNKEKAKAIFKDYEELGNISYIVTDVRKHVQVDSRIDYIFHCASITTGKTMVEQPVETLLTSIEGTKNLLEIAKDKAVSSFVYISSMEMYGTFEDEKNCNVTEVDLGYIDPLKVRSNYPESKRLCENMCIAYMSEYNIPIKIARLAQTFGAGILPGENRVFAQFARSVMDRENIVLHTEGNSEGNYCYTSDCIIALAKLLLDGKVGEAYNVVNPANHTTIREMAKLVCENFSEGNSEVVFDIPEGNVFGYASDAKLKLNADKLMGIGWKPQVDLIGSYDRMIKFMREES